MQEAPWRSKLVCSLTQLPVSPPSECRIHAEEGSQVLKDKIKNYFSNGQMFNICSITGDNGSFGLQCPAVFL